MRRAVGLLGATGGLLGVAGGLVATGLIGDQYVAVTSGPVTLGWRVLAASSVLAGAAATGSAWGLVLRDWPRAWLVLALAGLAGLVGGRGYFMVPVPAPARGCAARLPARAGPPTRDACEAGCAPPSRRPGAGSGRRGARPAHGPAPVRVRSASYWATGRRAAGPGLEDRLIAFSVLLCGVTILVAAGLMRSHPRPAAGLLLLAAVYGLLGGLSLWFPAGLLAVREVWSKHNADAVDEFLAPTYHRHLGVHVGALESGCPEGTPCGIPGSVPRCRVDGRRPACGCGPRCVSFHHARHASGCVPRDSNRRARMWRSDFWTWFASSTGSSQSSGVGLTCWTCCSSWERPCRSPIATCSESIAAWTWGRSGE